MSAVSGAWWRRLLVHRSARDHLQVLRDARLVRAGPHGRCTYHLLPPEALHAVAGQLGALAEVATGHVRRRPCP